MTKEEWVKFSEDGHLLLTDDAPEQVREWIERDPERAEYMLRWGATMLKAGHDVEEWHISDYRDLEKYHIAQQDKAVENGDIEAAQHHQELAEDFRELGEEYFQHISGGDSDGR